MFYTIPKLFLVIAMLNQNTRITTDYGVIPLYKVITGMYVDTPEGKSYIKRLHSQTANWNRLAIFLSNKTRVDCDKFQMFWYDEDNSVNSTELKVGDKLAAKSGQLIITHIMPILSKLRYYEVKIAC